MSFKREIKMSSSKLILTKLPYAKSVDDIIDSYNYSVKTINSAYINSDGTTGISSGGDTPPVVMEAEFTGSLTYAGADQVQNYTFNHNFGSIPNEWLVLDIESSVGASSNYEYYTFIRTSWTTTQISLKLTYKNNIGTGGVSFKLMVKG